MSILILSEGSDKSSDIVCSWLNKYAQLYLRVNREQCFNPQICFTISENGFIPILYVNDIKINLFNFRIVWFRRGYIDFFPTSDYSTLSNMEQLVIANHLKNEGNTLSNSIYSALTYSKHINHPSYYNYNKISALHKALKCGFNIPETILTSNSLEIKEFITKRGYCITKSIQDISTVMLQQNEICIGKIAQVKPEDITEQSYWYSLFQKEIPKRYELRIFYWLGKMYAMAIFSQMDKESELDFRNVDVNGSHPNRMVPYNLPKGIRLKLRKLMKTLKLESGSIDMIVTPENEYVFLEVNPVGQFNFVSELCNYYIEKDIAEFLAK